MRFDLDRALALSERFRFPRQAGTDGERLAADLVAEDFTRSGLQVERLAVQGSRFSTQVAPWLDLLAVGALATAGALLTVRGAAALYRLPPLILGLFWFRQSAIYGYRFGANRPPRAMTENVTARRQLSSDPSVRVVFVAALDTIAPRRSVKLQWANFLTICGLLFLLLMSIMHWFVPLVTPEVPSIGEVWVSLLLRALWSRNTLPDDGGDDNRTGLAVLLELARTWPRGTAERIETQFAAVGGHALDYAGARALLRSLYAETPPKPTLVLVFVAPGMGARLALGATRKRHLAESAASDLWIPHRLVRRRESLGAFWPFDRLHEDFICLIGDELVYPPSQPRFDPEVLSRAAQLATEIALRWAKQ